MVALSPFCTGDSTAPTEQRQACPPPHQTETRRPPCKRHPQRKGQDGGRVLGPPPSSCSILLNKIITPPQPLPICGSPHPSPKENSLRKVKMVIQNFPLRSRKKPSAAWASRKVTVMELAVISVTVTSLVGSTGVQGGGPSARSASATAMGERQTDRWRTASTTAWGRRGGGSMQTTVHPPRQAVL